MRPYWYSLSKSACTLHVRTLDNRGDGVQQHQISQRQDCNPWAGRSVSPKVSEITKILDPRIFGCLPEFRKKLSRLDVQNASKDLGALTKGDLDAAIIGIPKQWDISVESLKELAKLLFERGRYVADTIEEKLWPQKELDFASGDES